MDVKEQDRKNPSSVPPLVKATYVLSYLFHWCRSAISLAA